eukprot:62923-Rhodomonas_salina.1
MLAKSASDSPVLLSKTTRVKREQHCRLCRAADLADTPNYLQAAQLTPVSSRGVSFTSSSGPPMAVHT